MEALQERTFAELLPIKKQVAYAKPHWWDHEQLDNYEGRCRSVLRSWLKGELNGKVMTYGSKRKGHHLLFTKKGGAELWMMKNNPSIKVSVCVAKRVNGCFVGNSSSLGFMREVKSQKVRAVAHHRLKIQEVMGECLTMVPFQMFKETQLDIDTLTMIEKGPEEQLNLGRKVKGEEVQTHFTGAMLFKIKVRNRSQELKGQKEQYYLFDLDRNDLRLRNLNFFLSRLGRPATSIQDAYDSLKPQEVYEAEKFLGRPCERQGEWFFIPVQGEFQQATVRNQWSRRGRPMNAEAVLQAKGNRAHFVERLSVEGYVKGKVSHGGLEHKPIMLDGWHKAVPNTAVESFKISGAID